ncbi:hypothetical protein ACOMHN_038881 [Nucella lapillus]
MESEDDDIIEIDDVVIPSYVPPQESWWSELAEAEMQPMPDRMEQTGVLEKAQEIRDKQRKETEDAEWVEEGVNEETLLTSMKQWSLEDEPLLTFERCTDDLCHLFKNVIFHPALGRHCRDWKEGATQGVVDGLLQHLMQPEDVAIYVDGSFRRDFGVGGWAFTVYCQGLNLHSASGYVEETFATAFTMEAVAVTEALLWLTTRTRNKSVFLLSDCQRLLTMVQDGVCVEEWLSAAGSLTVKDVTWIYCPAHCGVKGNAKADLLAKEAGEAGFEMTCLPTHPSDTTGESIIEIHPLLLCLRSHLWSHLLSHLRSHLLSHLRSHLHQYQGR